MTRTVPEVVSEATPPVPVVVAGWVVDPDPDDAAIVPISRDRLFKKTENLPAEAQMEEAYDWTSCTLSPGQASTVQS